MLIWFRLKEASSGYFKDYSRASSASGGKLWIGPPVLIREDVSYILVPICISRDEKREGEGERKLTS